MTVYYILKFRPPLVVTLEGCLRGCQQLVGDAAEGTYNNYDRSVLSLFLNNTFYT